MTALSRRSFLLGTAAVAASAAVPAEPFGASPAMLTIADIRRELRVTGFVGYAIHNSGAVEMLRYEDVFGGPIAGIVDSE